MTVALRRKTVAEDVRRILKLYNGAFFDAQDMSTMFQDAAGATPVTAMEQPVGLWLDKSQGLALGPELVSNGTFDSGIAGWEQKYNATTSYSLGSLKVMPATIDTNGAFAGQAIPTAIGRSYKVTFDLVTANAATYIRALNNINAPWAYTYGIAGAVVGNKITLVFTATATVTYIAFGVSGSGSLTNAAVYDNISVRELYGNHATQSVTASRPVVSARYNLLTKTEDFTSSVWGKSSGTTITDTKTINFSTSTISRVTQTVTGNGDFELKVTFAATDVGKKIRLGFWANGIDGVTPGQGLSPDLTIPDNGVVSYTKQGLVGLSNIGIINSSDGLAKSLTIMNGAGVSLLANNSPVKQYQRVNTATDYDTIGFKKYLKFDGVDDYLNLPYMGLYANGSASMVIARDELLHGFVSCDISERSTASTNQKYFLLRQIPFDGRMDTYVVNDTGAIVIDTAGSVYGPYIDAVVWSVVDTGSNITQNKNGVQVAVDNNYARAGTLTLTNTTIGASVSTTTSNYANMKLYGLAITKSALSDSERRRVERLLAYNCGVQL